MATLVSPGVSVSVIDESNYAPTGPGTVPFILIATAQNKNSTAGGIASYTTAATANTLQLVSSQKELLSNYGLPIFPSDASGNRLFGSELAEYGLMAAHSTLAITNQAYILRANVDLNALVGSSSRPYGNPAGGTQWIDTATVSWGIFQWDAVNQVFNVQNPLVITNTSQLTSGVPLTSVGTVGSYAVVATDTKNPIYQKAYDNSWNLLGSSSWQSKTPALVGTSQAAALTSSNSIVVNGTTVTLSGTTAAGLAAQVNGASITGVTAAVVNGYFYFFVTSAAKSNGSTTDGKLIISNSSGTTLSATGGLYIAPGTYYGASFTFAPHYQVPTWKTTDSTPRPSGSVWIKTTAVNSGTNFTTYRWNSATNNWDSIPAPVYSGRRVATYGIDPTLGGLGIATNTLFVKYDVLTTTTATFKLYQWLGSGTPLAIIGSLSNPTFTGSYSGAGTTSGQATVTLSNTTGITQGQQVTGVGIPAGTTVSSVTPNTSITLSANATVTGTTTLVFNQFTIQTSVPGSSSPSSTYTINLSGTTAASFVSDVLAANIPYLTCTLTSAGNIQFGHTNAGDIVFGETIGTPLSGITAPSTGTSGGAGIVPNTTAYVSYDQGSYTADNGTTFIASFWQPAQNLYQQSVAPTVAPTDGSLWYYESPLEVDIMINNGTTWKGYKNVTSDSRGYNLANTDPLGPIISTTAPTKHTDGTALSYGDIWVSTANLENYPQIYRWQRLNGTDQWVLINNSDRTTENGILFADARWDTAGTADPAIDAKPTILSLLTSDYLDLDAPNPQIYPRGMLLFNTRRSSHNVKKYVASKFNSTNYPLQSLPNVAATWQSYSGNNALGVPYMGRKAVRNVVVSALSAAVDNSITAREDQHNFNLLVCPGYPELTDNLAALNNDRRQTGFILADTPMGLTSDTTAVNNYITNSNNVASDGEDGLVTNDPYTAVFYPGAAYTNALDGVGQVVVPITHAILRMIVKSDQASAPWFAPAGSIRGKIDNVLKIGYVDRTTGQFYSIGTNQGLRDLLYANNVNPVAVFPTEGILNYGNHTRQAAATALDRINVARLINYLRYNLERIAKPLVFAPNDTITRNEATQAVSGLLNDIVAQRGLHDYLVVCDTTNNTPSTIDRNELHIDIAIEPTKAVEFIYIPVRILNTGAIAGTGAGQGGLSNSTPSVALGTVNTTG